MRAGWPHHRVCYPPRWPISFSLAAQFAPVETPHGRLCIVITSWQVTAASRSTPCIVLGAVALTEIVHHRDQSLFRADEVLKLVKVNSLL